MKRKCRWCGLNYDTARESSVWCERNPRRGHKRGKPRIVRIGVMALEPNPWAKEEVPHDDRA